METKTIENLNLDGWTSIEDSSPYIEETVLAIIKYHNKGVVEHDFIVGYMDEYGGLINMYDEDNYGWDFNDCVIYWRYSTEDRKIELEAKP